MNSRILLFALFGLCTLAACKSKKAITQKPVTANTDSVLIPTSAQLLVRQVNTHENTFGYYSSRGKLSYKDESTEQELDVSIVMEKDRYIWMNVTALLGIEAARMKITNDSVIILDRLHRRCIVTNFDYIRKITHADLKLQQLQQIIAGNAPFAHDEKLSLVDSLASEIIITTLSDAQKQTAVYDHAFRLMKNTLDDRSMSRQFIVEYANPYTVGDNAYPGQVNINIRAEKNMECTFRLSNFVFEKKKEVSFSIPGNYEIVKP